LCLRSRALDCTPCSAFYLLSSFVPSRLVLLSLSFFFFNAPPPTEIYTLSLHDALPILLLACLLPTLHAPSFQSFLPPQKFLQDRSEEHTSELQSRFDLVCRLLLEKKKQTKQKQSVSNTETRARKLHTTTTEPQTADQHA